MGVKIIVHIRHIRGHTFDVEVDRDADCIGLKVVIWESQKIGIDTQRLVYAGKEVSDQTNLVELGIDDGSTIFLVEKVEVGPVSVPMEQPQSVEMIAVNEDSISVPVEPMSVNSQYYAPLGNDPIREERIQSTIDLAFWVRMYCIFGIVLSVGGLLRCWGSLIPLGCFIFGYIGCKKLNRCCLAFPFLLSVVFGPVGFVFFLWRLSMHFCPLLLAGLLASILETIIMASICKLRCRIKHLSCEEKCEAVERIRARSRCCCC